MEKKKVQSHGLSAQELRDLQIEQVSGDQKKIKANKDSSIEINAADAHLVHAEIEARQFNPQTGEKESTPIIQSFYPHEFASMEDQKAFSGKSVRIVHNPKDSKASDISSTDPAVLTGGSQGAGQAPQVDAEPEVVNPAAANGVVVGENHSGVNTTVTKNEKPVSQMLKPELLVKYKELYGEDADADATVPELKSAIVDKLAENDDQD